MPAETDAAAIIVEAFAPLAGKRVLDIGCGAGTLARSLSERGARVTGVDPNTEALEIAREAVPEGVFQAAHAESLPFANGSFEGAIFLNSLHHVPGPAMDRALQEAARVVGSAGPIVVVEPLDEGSCFLALRPVEDEGEVRTAAQEALRRALEGGEFEGLSRVDYLRRERFEGLDQFLLRIIAVDPARAAVVAERRPEVAAAFGRHARVAADGSVTLEQPMRAHVLAARAPEAARPSTGRRAGHRPRRRPDR